MKVVSNTKGKAFEDLKKSGLGFILELYKAAGAEKISLTFRCYL